MENELRILNSPAWDFPAEITSEHGEYNGLDYDWVDEYGMTENHHPGLDVSMTCGTTLYAIADGRIVCSGTGVGDGSDGSLCVAYNNADDFCSSGIGQGRVQLQISADNYVIYGHCLQALKSPGSIVQAGDAIAISGAGGVYGSGGPHLHIEQRVRDASTSSGWKIIDPEPLLTGSYTPGDADFDIGDVVITNDSDVNFRDEPGTSSSIITTLPANTRGIVMNQYGPTYVAPYDWYKVLTRYGRGWIAAQLLDAAPSYSNLIANPTANANLNLIVPNRSVTALSQVSVNGSNRVLVDTLGSSTTGEGVRYESSRGKAITGHRYFGGVINQVKAADSFTNGKVLDFVRIAAYFTDGTTKYSNEVKLTVTNSWKGVVSGLLDVPSGKTIDWLSLQVAVDDPIALKFYTDNALLIEL